jgi:hypothetical protein
MLTVQPDHCPAGQERNPATSGPGQFLPGRPWRIRLAGAHSACPAIELYEAGILLDVVSSTRLAPQLLRGARSVAAGPGQCALAWGRMPESGADVAVEFSRGIFRREVRAGTVVSVTSWCWIAVADGHFTRAVVCAGLRGARLRLARSRSWR